MRKCVFLLFAAALAAILTTAVAQEPAGELCTAEPTVQELSTEAVATAEPVAEPTPEPVLQIGGEPCGGVICPIKQYCCNPTCNKCLPFGMECTMQACNSTMPGLTVESEEPAAPLAPSSGPLS